VDHSQVNYQGEGQTKSHGKNPMVKKIAYAIGGAVIMLAGISLFFALTEDVPEDEPDLQDSPAT
jgi:hypothetical protein